MVMVIVIVAVSVMLAGTILLTAAAPPTTVAKTVGTIYMIYNKVIPIFKFFCSIAVLYS